MSEREAMRRAFRSDAEQLTGSSADEAYEWAKKYAADHPDDPMAQAALDGWRWLANGDGPLKKGGEAE